MCGIIGVLGNHEVAPILVEGLRRLEYRGYDSAGVATVVDGRLESRRAVGKLAALSDLLVDQPIHGKAGIGHTRWATHGAATTANAHPHIAGRVAVVHNGIIENYRELRAELSHVGITCQSETDTEVIAQYCAHLLQTGKTPQEAAVETLGRLRGAYAICFLFEGEEDLIIVAKHGSPIAIGHGEGEMFVGSDAIAMASHTNRITYLEEGDYAFVTREGAAIYTADGLPANREIKTSTVDAAIADKGPFRHFMAKEIHQQSEVIARTISHYLSSDRIKPNQFQNLDFNKIDRVLLVACGTGHYACHVAKYWFEQIARIPTEIDIASEFRYRDPVLKPTDSAVFVSQSGETADTLAALNHVEGKVGQIISVVNATESTIARASDSVLPIHAGIEVGVASTKAFTCQLLTLLSLALYVGRQKGTVTEEQEAELIAQIFELPRLMNETIALEPEIEQHCKWLSGARDILFLGRGVMYPMALEGALKLKEISYIHAEGYASGELKHGPIALVDDDVPVIVFAPSDAMFDKTSSNMAEVMARGGKVLLVTDENGAASCGADPFRTLILPSLPPLLAPIVYAIPAQLLAYHTAVIKGTDVDQPRNLAKSVTVE